MMKEKPIKSILVTLKNYNLDNGCSIIKQNMIHKDITLFTSKKVKSYDEQLGLTSVYKPAQEKSHDTCRKTSLNINVAMVNDRIDCVMDNCVNSRMHQYPELGYI